MTTDKSTRAATSLEELRQIAEKATPGPWSAVSDLPSFGVAAEAPHPDPVATLNRAYRAPHRKNLGCWENDARFIAAFNPIVASALLDAVSVLESISLRAGMTQLADCCVDKTCTPYLMDGKEESGCTWQAGVARGFSECAGVALDALQTLKAAGVSIGQPVPLSTMPPKEALKPCPECNRGMAAVAGSWRCDYCGTQWTPVKSIHEDVPATSVPEEKK